MGVQNGQILFMAAECDDLNHGRSFVAQIGQSSGAKVVESQWAFYTPICGPCQRPFRERFYWYMAGPSVR